MNDNQIDETIVTLQDMIDLLPKRVELYYVDYRDNLDEQTEELQACISQQDYSPIDEVTSEWFWESEAESVDYLLKELCKDLQRNYDVDEDSAEALVEENRDTLQETLYDRDESTPLKDLLRNTSNLVCFYDTGFYIDSESWTWTRSELRSWREKVKRALHVPSKNHKHDKDLELMLIQASYGGRLVIYFLLDADDFETFVNLDSYNTIQFKNPMVAIIDTFNGSGDSTDLPGHVLQLRLNASNIVLDKTIKYNYTYEVCGMFSNWCDCTEYELLYTVRPGKVAKSTINVEKEREERYKKTFASGGCTTGDMDMRRHRNTFYINDFPCGTKCPNCLTFWID